MEIVKQVMLCLCLVGFVVSSAIPMWEMLSREEKVSLFNNQTVKLF